MKNIYRVCVLFTLVALSQLSLKAQWVKCTAVPGDNSIGSGTQLVYLAVNGSRLFVPRPGGLDSIFYSDNSGSSWSVSRVPPWVIGGTSYYPSVQGTWVNNGVIFTSGSVSQGNVFWRSTDNGVTWIASSSGIITTGINPTPNVFFGNGNTIYIGTGGSGLFLSTNNGVTWDTASAGIPQYTFLSYKPYAGVNAIAAIGNDIFAALSGTGTTGFGIYHTTLGSKTWDSVKTGLPPNAFALSLISVGTTLYTRAVSYAPFTLGIYKSTNLGVSWTNTSNGWLGGNNLSTGAQELYAVGNNIFADVTNGVDVSTDGGGSWPAMNSTGLPATYYVNGYAIIGGTMFITVVDATTFPTTTAVWKRALSQITDVHEVASAVPNTFSLGQNYPNPFNPNTKIRFEVRNMGFVSLKVYDVLGREVATLVNENLHAGSYETALDASRFASGVYYYTVQAGNFVETKKMVLTK